MLSEINNDLKATEIFINLLKKVKINPPKESQFPNLETWCKKLIELNEIRPSVFPKQLIEAAYSLYQDLIKDQGKQILLHGDLHHYNILRHQNQWLAIDPKGVIGEAEFEFGAFMRNPIESMFYDADLRKRYDDRYQLLSEQRNYDLQKIKAWSFVQALLGAYWAYEDQLPMWKKFLSCAIFLKAYV